MTQIRDFFKYGGVTGYASRHGVDNTLPQPERFVGIELEIENWSPAVTQEFGGLLFATDGSLRGDGIEAITLPIAIKHVPAFLNAFFTRFNVGERNYSERCSTHVHFNIQDLTWHQLSVICLVYQTVERLLFNYVGHERNEGVFCVPWSQSTLSYHLVDHISAGADKGYYAVKKWMKYSALNLLPIRDKGTIEFRHLHGTCDVKTIVEWISILAKMFEYAGRVSLEEAKSQITNMNTISNYREWLYGVFGKYADIIQTPDSEALLAQGVIDSKLMLIQPPSPAHKSIYSDILNHPTPRVVTGEDGRARIVYDEPTLTGARDEWLDNDEDELTLDVWQPPRPPILAQSVEEAARLAPNTTAGAAWGDIQWVNTARPQPDLQFAVRPSPTARTRGAR